MEQLFNVDGGVSGGSCCILFGPAYTLYVQLDRNVAQVDLLSGEHLLEMQPIGTD